VNVVRVDITETINGAALMGLPLVVAGVAFLIMIADGLDLQAMAFAAPAVANEWDIKREALGPVLAACVAGMGGGSLLLGWAGDRVGRKAAFVSCLALLAIGSAGCALSGTLGHLVAWRLTTGIGLGGAAPLAATLSSEWTPARWRTFVVVAIIVGVPLGGVLGAEWSAEIIPRFGWRSVFWTGAMLPMLLLASAMILLPDSPRSLTGGRESGKRVASALNRLMGERRFSGNEDFFLPDGSMGQRVPLWSVLTPPFLATTLLLCATFSFNSLALYGFANWLPTMLTAATFSLTDALHGSLWFNLGGIAGALAGSAVIGYYGSRSVGTGMAVTGAISVAALGGMLAVRTHYAVGDGAVLGMVALAGACLNGIQTLLYAVSVHSYPAPVRSTGTGYASAAARIGGVLSSAVGSALFALGFAVAQFFFALAAVAVVTALLFFALRKHLPPVNTRLRHDVAHP
jgi:AAHS family 4-hydroxybenzoate transporter-like MFS transporter